MQLRSGRRFDQDKVRSITELYATMDLREELPQLRAEVVVGVGTWDPPHRGPAGDILRLVPHSDHVLLRGGGHETNRSAPEQLAAEITKLARA